MPKAETADFPRTLKINFASIRLAVALHRAKCQAFGPASMWRFSELKPSLRRAYIDRAAWILRTIERDGLK